MYDVNVNSNIFRIQREGVDCSPAPEWTALLSLLALSELHPLSSHLLSLLHFVRKLMSIFQRFI